jgi:hypothetical protein
MSKKEVGIALGVMLGALAVVAPALAQNEQFIPDSSIVRAPTRPTVSQSRTALPITTSS